MSSEGKDVDDYMFTTTNEQSTPYIEWKDATDERVDRRCATISPSPNKGLHPANCSGTAMKYFCEFDGKEIRSERFYQQTFSLKKRHSFL